MKRLGRLSTANFAPSVCETGSWTIVHLSESVLLIEVPWWRGPVATIVVIVEIGASVTITTGPLTKETTRIVVTAVASVTIVVLAVIANIDIVAIAMIPISIVAEPSHDVLRDL